MEREKVFFSSGNLKIQLPPSQQPNATTETRNTASNLMTQAKLLSTKEAAAFIGVEEQSLRRWRMNGIVKIPFIRLGRLVRYSMKDLEAYIEKNTRVRT